MRRILILVSLVAFFMSFGVRAALAAVDPAACTARGGAITEKKAREFMRRRGLIRPGEERSFPRLGIEIRWGLSRMVASEHGCFAVMRICNFTGERKNCEGTEAEVLGLVLAPSPEADTVRFFERIHPVQKRVIAKIGTNGESDDPSYYYALLSGKSALDALKSAVSKTPYPGFSATASRGAKASWDPTPGRNWKIENATFSLRRGLTAEVLDIQAYQLDGLDDAGAEAYWSGCHRPRNSGIGKCSLAPWGQAYVREILPAPDAS